MEEDEVSIGVSANGYLAVLQLLFIEIKFPLTFHRLRRSGTSRLGKYREKRKRNGVHGGTYSGIDAFRQFPTLPDASVRRIGYNWNDRNTHKTSENGICDKSDRNRR